jgi:hypothetical protein
VRTRTSDASASKLDCESDGGRFDFERLDGSGGRQMCGEVIGRVIIWSRSVDVCFVLFACASFQNCEVRPAELGPTRRQLQGTRWNL